MARGSPDFSGFGPRRRISNGIEAKTTRGAFGKTWWGKQFIERIEGLADAGRLSRGRTYARGGQVISLQVRHGLIQGDVQGSQIEPFSATVTIAPLDPFQDDLLQHTVLTSPGMLTELASGSVPQLLEPYLLPTEASGVQFDCTCPDGGSPCKHAAALTYLTAEQIDEDVSILLRLRGADLDTLMGGAEASLTSVDPDDHFGDRTVLPPLPEPTFAPAPHELEASLIRTALRTADVDEGEIRLAMDQLNALYRRLQ